MTFQLLGGIDWSQCPAGPTTIKCHGGNGVDPAVVTQLDTSRGPVAIHDLTH